MFPTRWTIKTIKISVNTYNRTVKFFKFGFISNKRVLKLDV